jgi:hypothetical protein
MNAHVLYSNNPHVIIDMCAINVLSFCMICNCTPSPRLALRVETNFPNVGAEARLPTGRLASARISPPAKYHRYNSIKSHSLTKSARPSLLFSEPSTLFQKSAHLTENTNDQLPLSSHSCALFCCTSLIFSTLTKTYRGCIPPTANLTASPATLFRISRLLARSASANFTSIGATIGNNHVVA